MKRAPLLAALLLVLSVVPVRAVYVERMVVIGDSITACCWARGATWPTTVSGDLPQITLVANAGVRGNKTADMLARLPLVLSEHHPDVVIILGGTNDDMHNTGRANAMANLRAMVDLVKASGAVPILMTLPPNPHGVTQWNADITALATDEGIPLVDIWAVLGTSGTQWLPGMTDDVLHPSTPAGQAAIVGAIKPVLNALYPLG